MSASIRTFINLPEPTTPDEKELQDILIEKNPILQSGIEQVNKLTTSIKQVHELKKIIKKRKQLSSQVIEGNSSLKIQKKIRGLEEKYKQGAKELERVNEELNQHRVNEELKQHNAQLEEIVKICAPLKENKTPETIEAVKKELREFNARLTSQHQEEFSSSSSVSISTTTSKTLFSSTDNYSSEQVEQTPPHNKINNHQ